MEKKGILETTEALKEKTKKRKSEKHVLKNMLVLQQQLLLLTHGTENVVVSELMIWIHPAIIFICPTTIAPTYIEKINMLVLHLSGYYRSVK